MDWESTPGSHTTTYGDHTARLRGIVTRPSRESAAFQHHFRDLNHPRLERTRKHPRITIASLAVRGVLAGANSFAAIPEFGLDRRTGFARSRDLTHGIPSDDTFARVLARLDPGAFENCLGRGIPAVQEITDPRRIALEARRSGAGTTGQAALPNGLGVGVGEQAVARPRGRE